MQRHFCSLHASLFYFFGLTGVLVSESGNDIASGLCSRRGESIAMVGVSCSQGCSCIASMCLGRVIGTPKTIPSVGRVDSFFFRFAPLSEGSISCESAGSSLVGSLADAGLAMML